MDELTIKTLGLQLSIYTDIASIYPQGWVHHPYCNPADYILSEMNPGNLFLPGCSAAANLASLNREGWKLDKDCHEQLDPVMVF